VLCFRVLALLISLHAAYAVADPRINYLLHCSGCHLPNGESAPPEVPSLRDQLGAIASSSVGRDYLARVPGAAQTPLSDSELAEVLNWVLREFNAQSLPESFVPLTASEVAQSRQNVLVDPEGYRKRLWPSSEDVNRNRSIEPYRE